MNASRRRGREHVAGSPDLDRRNGLRAGAEAVASRYQRITRARPSQGALVRGVACSVDAKIGAKLDAPGKSRSHFREDLVPGLTEKEDVGEDGQPGMSARREIAELDPGRVERGVVLPS